MSPEDKTVYIEHEGQYHAIPLQAADFEIDPTNLDGQLCTIGKLLFNYGELDARIKLRVGNAKAGMEKLVAELDAQVRNDFLKDNIKATESKVENTIKMRSEYQQATEAYNLAIKDECMMRWTMTALVHKSEALRAMAYRENQVMKSER